MYHFVLQLTSNKWVIFVLAHCNIIIKLVVFKLSKFSLFITLINHKPIRLMKSDSSTKLYLSRKCHHSSEGMIVTQVLLLWTRVSFVYII